MSTKTKRLFHPWHEWECVHAGMYQTTFEGFNADELRQRYAEFLADCGRFRSALDRVLAEWPRSCEQFLSNDGINRIAWLGQAAMCMDTGVPSRFRGGFKLLSTDQQDAANAVAAGALEQWLQRAQG